MRKLWFAISCAALLTASTSAHAQFGRAADVVVEKVTMQMLAPSVDVPGTVISKFDARLASELSARITWIAEVGTHVEEGDVVARLEQVNYQLLEMEANGEVQREEARVEYLESEVARLQRLATENNAAKSLLEKTISDLGVAKGDLEIAKANLGRAKVAMYTTQIRAPFSGVVTERLRNLGERLNVADEVIRLTDPDSIEVVARAPLNTVNYISVDDELSLHNDYRSDTASVRTIVPFGDPESHMFEVRLDVSPDTWVVGESLRVSMPMSEAREVMTVPRDALVLRRSGSSVYRVSDDMKAERVSVVTGAGAGAFVEIAGSLQPGDQIIVRGAERLADGDSVNIRSNLGSNADDSSPSM